MADATVAAPARYSAFISYSHADAADARWLHRRLETYRLPRRLQAGTRLRPVFHDSAELRAAADLDDEIRAALAAAQYLIVVCSPSAVTSKWVAREIELFRELNGDARILAALFHGDEQGAFPAGLLGSRGHVPLAADFRSHHGGRRLALLKLVARLASVDLDALVQRDAHRFHRRLAIVATVAVMVALAMAALAVVAVRAQAAAEVQRNKAEGFIDFMLVDLRKRLKGVGNLDLLTTVNKRAIAYYDGIDLTRLPEASLRRRAALLQAMGEDDERRRDLAAASRKWQEARRTTAALLAADPVDPKRIFAHSQSEYWVGFAAWRGGDLAAAERAFREYARLTDTLRRIEPGNLDYLMEQGYAASNLGAFTLRPLGDGAAAEAQFRKSLAAFQIVADRRGMDPDTGKDIADGWGWIADAQKLQRRYAEADASRQQQRAMLSGLATANPGDNDLRSRLVGNAIGRARIAVASGRPEAAAALLRSVRDLAWTIARRDPSDNEAREQARMVDLIGIEAALVAGNGVPNIRQTAFCANGIGPADDEVHAFCRNLRDRALTGGGHQGLPRPVLPTRLKVGRYTPKWGLDFSESTFQS